MNIIFLHRITIDDLVWIPPKEKLEDLPAFNESQQCNGPSPPTTPTVSSRVPNGNA